jgi:hypothetical protein
LAHVHNVLLLVPRGEKAMRIVNSLFGGVACVGERPERALACRPRRREPCRHGPHRLRVRAAEHGVVDERREAARDPLPEACSVFARLAECLHRADDRLAFLVPKSRSLGKRPEVAPRPGRLERLELLLE